MNLVRDLDIDLLERYEWTLELDDAEFALPCPICGKSVGNDGITAEIGGRTLTFCCQSCEEKYQNKHENYRENSE